MIKRYAGAGEGVLDGGGEAIGVAVGGDGKRTKVVQVDEGRAYVLGNGVRVESFGDLAVFYIPPHRCLCPRILTLCCCSSSSSSSTRLSVISTHI